MSIHTVIADASNILSIILSVYAIYLVRMNMKDKIKAALKKL